MNKKNNETVEQAAMLAILNATGENPQVHTDMYKYFVSGAKFGAQWREENPVKGEVKSVEEIVNDFLRRKPRYTKQDVITELQKYLPPTPKQDKEAANIALDALRDCQQLIQYLIEAIPTGKVRETATNCNIIALSAIQKATELLNPNTQPTN